MTNDLPFISVIIPARNEESFIGRTLDSLIANDYPKDKLEILVVDGISEDRTKEIVAEYAETYPYIKLLENPKKITPIAMNIGIHNAQGSLVTKTDAHSIYPVEYLSKCARYIEKYHVEAVGGVARATPSLLTLKAAAISLSLSSWFGSGGGGLRYATGEPRLADTAFGICYKKDAVIKAGLFNENLTRSQDMDLNIRLQKMGGKILLVPDIMINYYSKATLMNFLRHNVQDGIWAVYPLKFGSPVFKLRHLAPLIFIVCLFLCGLTGLVFAPAQALFLGIICLYFILALAVSANIAHREKQYALIPYLIAAFAIRHFAYGFGSLIGLTKLLRAV